MNREEYDLAVVPRQDAEGLVIAYAEKNSNTLGDMTLESVFSVFSGQYAWCDHGMPR